MKLTCHLYHSANSIKTKRKKVVAFFSNFTTQTFFCVFPKTLNGTLYGTIKKYRDTKTITKNRHCYQKLFHHEQVEYRLSFFQKVCSGTMKLGCLWSVWCTMAKTHLIFILRQMPAALQNAIQWGVVGFPHGVHHFNRKNSVACLCMHVHTSVRGSVQSLHWQFYHILAINIADTTVETQQTPLQVSGIHWQSLGSTVWEIQRCIINWSHDKDVNIALISSSFFQYRVKKKKKKREWVVHF